MNFLKNMEVIQLDEIVLNTEEAAEFIRVKKSQLYKLVSENKIPHHRVVGKLVFFKGELIEWIRKN